MESTTRTSEEEAEGPAVVEVEGVVEEVEEAEDAVVTTTITSQIQATVAVEIPLSSNRQIQNYNNSQALQQMMAIRPL
jgi:hypothetical protein